MSISRKFVLLCGTAITAFAAICLTIVYAQSRRLIISEEKQRSLAIIRTLDAMVTNTTTTVDLQADINELQQRDNQLVRLDLYKLSGATATAVVSTVAADVGKKADSEDVQAAKSDSSVVRVSGNIIDVTAPIHGSDGVPNYVVGVQFSMASALQQLAQLLWAVLGTGVVLLLLTVAAVWWVTTRTILRPLRVVIGISERIADGILDESVPIHSDGKDEVSRLGRAFSKMQQNLRSVIGQVMSTADQVAASAEELSASANETCKASEHIAGVIQQIAAGSETQLSRIEIGQQVIDELSDALEKIAAGAAQVTANAQQASDLATSGRNSVAQSIQQMHAIHGKITDLTQTMEELNQKSVHVGSIVETITTIAEQTNLLALNAAIEAARAGAEGKGFSVVAAEVRALAEQSAKSAQSIQAYVQDIQNHIASAVEATRAGAAEVSTGIATAETSGTAFTDIHRAVEEVAEQIRGVNDAAQRLTQSTRLSDAIRDIHNVANTNATGTQDAGAATEQQLATMEEIAASATALTSLANELVEAVRSFQI
ncbi:hypothetical protein GCM10025857_30660 [Alicyclobacillus contaminans]|uniref:methyl-accepting chemotaxis protein n=1 Tax=Alicyclobacillus contaminans TaxID=392016 RepID=UPI000416462B|nr:HAMP domain-containing methyl-accepting chemotaxis protein [Alicyclobacillus contaminans]GMA51709.1 hypothetical protein GCM10025857_30660 [Alicyclobacillus contaminans]